MRRMSARSRTPSLPSSSSCEAESAVAADAARSGQWPPARLAIARSGSQISAARSPSISGTVGQSAARVVMFVCAHRLIAARSSDACASISRRRNFSTVSLMLRRLSRMTIDRSCTVSGNRPIPASATGANTGNRSTPTLRLVARMTARRRRAAHRRPRDNDRAAEGGASRESEYRQRLVRVHDEQRDPAEPRGSDEDERTGQGHGEPARQGGLHTVHTSAGSVSARRAGAPQQVTTCTLHFVIGRRARRTLGVATFIRVLPVGRE